MSSAIEKSRLAADWAQVKAEKYGKPRSTEVGEKKPHTIPTRRQAAPPARSHSLSRMITDEILGNLPIRRTQLLDRRIEDLVSTRLKSDRFESRRACIRSAEEVRARDEEILRLRRELKNSHRQFEGALERVRALRQEIAIHKRLAAQK